MAGKWNFSVFKALCAVLVLHLIDRCVALNLEGLALWGFRLKVEVDPSGVFKNWDPRDGDPCNWVGVYCINGNVEMLNLKGLSLGGILAPELGKLSHLRTLVLYKNNFSGIIPKEIGGLTMLELLDLRGNNLSGTIPTEIGEMLSLKSLLLCDNKFQDGSPSRVEKLSMLSDLKSDGGVSCDVASAEVGFLNRKVRHCFWQTGLQHLKKANSILIPLKGKLLYFLEFFSSLNVRREFSYMLMEEHSESLQAGFRDPHVVQNAHHVYFARRKLVEAVRNLPAASVSSVQPQDDVAVPDIGSGSFPAVPEEQPPPPIVGMTSPTQSAPAAAPPSPSKPKSSKRLGKWLYILLAVVALLLILAIILWTCRSNGVAVIRPRKTGISGQLQKAFITGVPKLDRSELEAACEDFSNIISTCADYTVFKGTLSSGVEIAVVSSAVASAKDWSRRSEMCFRRKIDTISQVKHKNFINLIGYCQEDAPFMRMMVFEYAPNGTLFEHLHVKEFEHLEWSTRMRIIMGVAYCLQHMHHELTPPIAHPCLLSSSVFITDDYAGKLADMSIWKEVVARGKLSGDDSVDRSQFPFAEPENDVYNFGILLLEVISGKVPYSEEQDSILTWAADYLNDKRKFSSLTDTTLKSVNDKELEVICDVIQECIHQDPKSRPIIKDVTAKLREVIAISPEAATPRLSPLWWAELEILSVEAS